MAMFHFRLKSDKKPNGTKISAVKHVEYINREGSFSHDEHWKESNKFVGDFITTTQTANALNGLEILLYKTDDFGSIKNWKRAYKLAKKSPVARIIIAAAIAPILLKILGERNFLLHIYAPTRAGKTTALYLAASAIGDEKIIHSFDATRNGLAGAAADVSDFPFLIDEKQVADSCIKEQLDTLVYSLVNGIGRTKLNKDSTLKKNTRLAHYRYHDR